LPSLAPTRSDARAGRSSAIEYTWKQFVTREAGPTAADEFERIILKG
jgi:hypothetical protein